MSQVHDDRTVIAFEGLEIGRADPGVGVEEDELVGIIIAEAEADDVSDVAGEGREPRTSRSEVVTAVSAAEVCSLIYVVVVVAEILSTSCLSVAASAMLPFGEKSSTLLKWMDSRSVSSVYLSAQLGFGIGGMKFNGWCSSIGVPLCQLSDVHTLLLTSPSRCRFERLHLQYKSCGRATAGVVSTFGSLSCPNKPSNPPAGRQ